MSPSRPTVLIVDDERFVTEIVSRWLEAAGYRCLKAANGPQALRAVEEQPVDLVISDINMPGMTGLELLPEIKLRSSDIAVIMATAVDDRRTAIRALQLGAYGYLIKPLDENEVIINVASGLDRRRLEMIGREYKTQLEREVRERTQQIRRAREEISLLLVTASEFRDAQTGTHVRRMGLYAEALARALGWGREAAEDMRLAAPMHDVGKIGVPDRILLKPGRLTDEEFDAVKRHAEIGAQILSGSEVELVRLAGKIAHAHHEKWDGSGYPMGLKGEAIPAAARLVAITDVYDALVHDRCYRPALAEEEALAIMQRGRGSHFDPHMFDVFLNLLPEIRRIRSLARDAAAEQPAGGAEGRGAASEAAASSPGASQDRLPLRGADRHHREPRDPDQR